jgi:hypothetical protein
MPFYTQPRTCCHGHCRSRFDPKKSDSNCPAFFCSVQCEKEWIVDCLRHLTLADVLDIQARACAGARMAASAVAGE